MRESEFHDMMMNIFMEAYTTNPGAIDSARGKNIGFTLSKDGIVHEYIIEGIKYKIGSDELSLQEMEYRLNMAYGLYNKAAINLIMIIYLRMGSIYNKHCEV